MAKVKGPLLSESASGSIGPRLTFSKRASGSQVRYQKAQTDYENAARKVIRDNYRAALVLWNSMPCAERAYWDEIERTGYADV